MSRWLEILFCDQLELVKYPLDSIRSKAHTGSRVLSWVFYANDPPYGLLRRWYSNLSQRGDEIIRRSGAGVKPNAGICRCRRRGNVWGVDDHQIKIQDRIVFEDGVKLLFEITGCATSKDDKHPV
jgi:hypothetical protein